MIKEIDIKQWERKAHYELLSELEYPHYNICFDIDVTKLLDFTKKKKISFHYLMIYLVTASGNQIEEFRYRKRGDRIVLHERIHPLFTHINDETGLFKMISVPMIDDWEKFLEEAKDVAKKQKELIVKADSLEQSGTKRDDFIYITAIPWISFTAISAMNFDKNDSFPRISWGKYYTRGSVVNLPFSVQVNHAFIDGIHIGRFEALLRENIKKLCEG